MVDSTFLVSCLSIVWPLVLEQKDKHNKSFRRALKAFVELAFHPSIILHCHDNGQPYIAMQQKVISILMHNYYSMRN